MKSFLPLSLTAMLMALLSGCVSLERTYPDKRFFVLEVNGRGVSQQRRGGQ